MLQLVPFRSFVFHQAQSSEEPPFLTVGTDVSAKYRGAFCEASVKVVKKLVKCKVGLQWSEHCVGLPGTSLILVYPCGLCFLCFLTLWIYLFFLLQITLAKTNASLTVNDDCVKGSLKVNFLFIVWVSMNVPLDNVLLRLPSCCYDTLVFEHFKIIFWGYFSFFQRLERLLRPKLLKEWWKESSLNSPMLVFTPLVNINDFSSYLWFSLGKETSTTQLNHNKFPISFLFTFLFQVFDDGDERTLRRTSLCLKGERHFNESEVCNWKKSLFRSVSFIVRSLIRECKEELQAFVFVSLLFRL